MINCVEKILRYSKYNYIVAPFGGGKSTLFKALENKLLSNISYINKILKNKKEKNLKIVQTKINTD